MTTMAELSFRTRLSLVAGLACALIAPASAAPVVREGEWEFVMTMDVAGVAMELPEVRFRNCISAKDPVPMRPQRADECKRVRRTVSGNTISYTLRCTYGQNTVEDHGKVTFHGNRMQGKLRQVMKENGKVIGKTTATMTGERVGDCKKPK